MEEYINSELIETTYLFCVKRISNSDAAKDLSHDILCEAIRSIKSGRKIVRFYSWYWRMAKNKCADYIFHKRNPALPIETAGGVAASMPEPIEKLIADEDISMLNFSLSRLASIHREIIVRFYLKEQPIAEIARKLGIPEGTVKRRLFDAKKNLKERLNNMENIGKSSYAPSDVGWFGGYCTQRAFEVLNQSKIAQQICVICRSEAKTINELADEMGVAPIYIEEVINRLVNIKLLKSPVKDKYLTNCCVFPAEVHYSVGVMCCREFCKNGFNERVSRILFDLKDKITALDFYGNGFDYKYLMWILYVIAGNTIGYTGRNIYLEKYKDKYKDDSERDYRITMLYQLPDENPDYS